MTKLVCLHRTDIQSRTSLEVINVQPFHLIKFGGKRHVLIFSEQEVKASVSASCDRFLKLTNQPTPLKQDKGNLIEDSPPDFIVSANGGILFGCNPDNVSILVTITLILKYFRDAILVKF